MYPARVTRVFDGDTLWVKPVAGGRYRKLRIDGIDAPEICQGGGAASRDALAARVLNQVVEVSVRYEDAANQIRFNDSFLFTEPVDQVFRIPVRADSPTGYELQITYFNKDGTAFPQTPVRTDKKHFPLPRFVPELAPQP